MSKLTKGKKSEALWDAGAAASNRKLVSKEQEFESTRNTRKKKKIIKEDRVGRKEGMEATTMK
ncbi:hypothetical protein CRE_07604 [Caenorhabditis remanei]|uniref:Uncharacterized protein n=1 Tax=Caenorhabditis remanei TaxID=31234 RepID=E3MP76_CAERE|nr:hypothetical protein CRE_07604 [Caenorhabditis remanei]